MLSCRQAGVVGQGHRPRSFGCVRCDRSFGRKELSSTVFSGMSIGCCSGVLAVLAVFYRSAVVPGPGLDGIYRSAVVDDCFFQKCCCRLHHFRKKQPLLPPGSVAAWKPRLLPGLLEGLFGEALGVGAGDYQGAVGIFHAAGQQVHGAQAQGDLVVAVDVGGLVHHGGDVLLHLG